MKPLSYTYMLSFTAGTIFIMLTLHFFLNYFLGNCLPYFLPWFYRSPEAWKLVIVIVELEILIVLGRLRLYRIKDILARLPAMGLNQFRFMVWFSVILFIAFNCHTLNVIWRIAGVWDGWVLLEMFVISMGVVTMYGMGTPFAAGRFWRVLRQR